MPKPVTHPASTPKPVVTPGGAPTTIASVLRRHHVAVVLVYDPQAKVDAFSLGETQLGAKRAHAGFLRVTVLNERQVLPFAKTYGVLQVPTVLFFARPGKLVQKLTGYADQDTVAQAALNAARGLVDHRGMNPAAAGRDVGIRYIRKDGRSVAVLRTVDQADSCVVEAEVFPSSGGSRSARARTRSPTTARPAPSSPTPSRR